MPIMDQDFFLSQIQESEKHWGPDPDPQHCLVKKSTLISSPFLVKNSRANVGSTDIRLKSSSARVSSFPSEQ